MVKNYFRLTLVYMISGDHRNHPTDSLPGFWARKTPPELNAPAGFSAN